MQSGDYSIIPAMAAGFLSLQGQIAKNLDNTLSIPEGMVNIGGNGYGYILQSQAVFDPYDAANRDASFSAVTLGDDIYIYACQASLSPYAKLLCSKNATYPDGYTATNSRKIGGFHVGRTRPISERFNAAYVPSVEIVPNSVWDEIHRPECSPEGMAEIAPGLWASIYQLSVISGTWPEITLGSRFGATPLRDTGGYARSDLYKGLIESGFILPTYQEWKTCSYGAPQGNDANNDTAWTATTNTGPTTTGAVAKSVSCTNIVDTVGNLWEYLDMMWDYGGTWAWTATVVDVGQDAAFDRGQIYHANWRFGIAGGYASGTVCLRALSRSRKA